MEYDPLQRTRVAARIVGPYLTIMGAMLALRAADMELMLPAFMQDGPLALAAGAVTLLAGLTLLALHHHLSSIAAALVTFIGVAATLKGAWLLIAPRLGAPLTAAIIRTPPLLIILALLMLAAGVWLSIVGWTGRPLKGTTT